MLKRYYLFFSLLECTLGSMYYSWFPWHVHSSWNLRMVIDPSTRQNVITQELYLKLSPSSWVLCISLSKSWIFQSIVYVILRIIFIFFKGRNFLQLFDFALKPFFVCVSQIFCLAFILKVLQKFHILLPIIMIIFVSLWLPSLVYIRDYCASSSIWKFSSYFFDFREKWNYICFTNLVDFFGNVLVISLVPVKFLTADLHADNPSQLECYVSAATYFINVLRVFKFFPVIKYSFPFLIPFYIG